MLQLNQTQRLQQKLSPAQVQYLKILQLPQLALEQRIKNELELNPLLEEGIEQEEILQEEPEISLEQEKPETNEPEEIVREFDDAITVEVNTSKDDEYLDHEIREHRDEETSWEEFFENNEGAASVNYYDNEDDREFATPADVTMTERLIDQLRMLHLSEADTALGEEIIGNLDDDGYLRRELFEIVMDVNLEYHLNLSLDDAEEVLKKVQRLEPHGIAARDLRECLLVQLETMPNQSTARIIAIRILRECYESFAKKHFDKIKAELHIGDDMLKKAFDIIRHLNPKPGEGTIEAETNYITPDFFVTRDKDDFIITLNDYGIPPLRVSKAYKQMLTTRNNRIPADAKQFLRQKMETAKWFIQSIYQRRQTMLAVMQTIIEKQRAFFMYGPGNLRPMIYRDIAEEIGMDISTISRVVNSKYVQTEWGVFELRFFFSEGIPTASGVDVSNKEVKSILKQIIDSEDPKKPLSDQAIMKILQKQGFDIARRTVAKYRESMGIPVSRLRTKIS